MTPASPAIPAPPAPSRAKRNSSHDGMNVSQAWFDEGDSASEAAESQRIRKSKRMTSPNTTDLNLVYDDEAPRKRWALVATLAVVAALGAVVFVATRSGGGDEPAAPPPPAHQVATATVDAAPSQVIEPASTPTDAAVAVVAVDAATVAKAPDKKSDLKPADPKVPVKHGDRVGSRDLTFPTTSDPATRRPGRDPAPPIPVLPKDKGVGRTNDPSDSSLTGDPGDAAGNEKKAEFFANLGNQQLASGDIAGAAGNFKKAVDLDAKNAVAVTGQGEIALRQGDFGAAIAHLTKASKLAPKSAKVFTLLGEAYLSSAQMPLAAANFKKALQLDPDNVRARDGYNEASSRVPPPTDDN
jgi:hypothetical protein